MNESLVPLRHGQEVRHTASATVSAPPRPWAPIRGRPCGPRWVPAGNGLAIWQTACRGGSGTVRRQRRGDVGEPGPLVAAGARHGAGCGGRRYPGAAGRPGDPPVAGCGRVQATRCAGARTGPAWPGRGRGLLRRAGTPAGRGRGRHGGPHAADGPACQRRGATGEQGCRGACGRPGGAGPGGTGDRGGPCSRTGRGGCCHRR